MHFPFANSNIHILIRKQFAQSWLDFVQRLEPAPPGQDALHLWPAGRAIKPWLCFPRVASTWKTRFAGFGIGYLCS